MKAQLRFGILLAGLSAMAACQNDPAKVKALTARTKLPVQTIYDVDLIYTDSAQLKVRMKAPVIEEFTGDKPYTELPKGVNLQFYDDSLHVKTSLTADYAVRREQEQIMEAKGNVVMINARGERLNTEHLIWNGKTDSIYTNSDVIVTKATEQIFAKGLKADAAFDGYEFNELTATINLEDPESSDSASTTTSTPHEP